MRYGGMSSSDDYGWKSSGSDAARHRGAL